MQTPLIKHPPSFDFVVRGLSIGSLLVACGLITVYFRTGYPGIEFKTHLLLILLFAGQMLACFIVVLAAVIKAATRDGLKLSRTGALLTLAASAGMVLQYYALQKIHVDGSTMP